MFVLRVGIDQVHKLFSHFTKNQVVGDLGRWRFWWWWHCWWCWWFWWWFGGADFGDDDDQVMGLGSSGWWWLSPGDGSSGWPVGVLPVHDLWLWTSPPGKGFNTELSVIKITRSQLTITYHWSVILIHSARVSILALYFSNWTRCDRVRTTTGSWTRPWCRIWATGVVHHNSWIDKINATLKQTFPRFMPHCKIIYNFKNTIAQIHATRRLEPWRPGLVLAPLVAGDLNILFL